ncbi:MAG: hypothetical protein ACXW13_12195 [Burkholderiaceae bacterium]
MHFTLLVAGALLQSELAAELTGSLNTPHLKARLSRATEVGRAVASPTGAAHLDWLAQNLFGRPASAPTAPYAYAQLAGKPAPAYVWHADPVHIEVARDRLLVQSLESDQLTAEESTPLLAAANECAATSKCEFVSVGEHWFLLSESEWRVDARPLSAVIEGTVEMPIGRDAQIWNRLHNEIQIAWHANDVNAEREAKGLRTINAVWLHGGGRWKSLAPIEFAQVHSDAPEWQGIAQAAGALGLPASAPLADTALVVSDGAWVSRRREDWSGWLQAMNVKDRALIDHPAASIDLVLCGDSQRTFRVRPSDRYKPWRRRTLVEALTE